MRLAVYGAVLLTIPEQCGEYGVSEHIDYELKTWPEFFDHILRRKKTFEIRNDDRNFKIGDLVLLREYEPISSKYTGRSILVRILYITSFGQYPGFVVFSFDHVRSATAGGEGE